MNEGMPEKKARSGVDGDEQDDDGDDEDDDDEDEWWLKCNNRTAKLYFDNHCCASIQGVCV